MIPNTGLSLNVTARSCKYFSNISLFYTCELNTFVVRAYTLNVTWNVYIFFFLFHLIMREDATVEQLSQRSEAWWNRTAVRTKQVILASYPVIIFKSMSLLILQLFVDSVTVSSPCQRNVTFKNLQQFKQKEPMQGNDLFWNFGY